jgi:predicted nucleic acid-binding protein
MASSIVDPRRPGRRLPPTNRFADSSDDEEDEEEEEQERLLSEQHGEAEESAMRNNNSNNKRQSKTDIEDEYGSTTTAKRMKRPTLTPAVLMGPKGLIRIRSEFGRKVRWPSSSFSSKRKEEDAAAAYSRSLIQTYKSFCYDLFPGSAFQDVLTRIESFGSKKEVKSYLQSMREEIRNNHLEKVYGKEKASHMIQELEHGLKQQQQHEVDYDDIAVAVIANENDGRRGPVLRSGHPTEPEPSNGGTNAPVTTEKATEFQADKREIDQVAEKNSTSGDDLQDTDDELEIVRPRKTSMTQGQLQQTAPTNPFESDDEEEHEESEPSANKAERKNVTGGTATDDKDASQNDIGLENVHDDSSDAEEETSIETQTQLESPELEEEFMTGPIVQETPSFPTGAMTLDETAPVVATMNTQLESAKPEAEQDKHLAPEDFLATARGHKPTLMCDEAPTAIATTEPHLPTSEDEEGREESLTPNTQEPTSMSDETATIVATMDTQLESPSEQKDLVEHDIGSSFTQSQSDEPYSQHGETLSGVSMEELYESSVMDPDTAMGE